MSSTNTPVTQADVEAAIVRLHGALVIGATLDQRAAVSSECPDLLRRLLAERDELRDRAEKAEAAQADERSARAVDLARLSKAEASVVAMLRRLKGELSALEKQRAADGYSGDAHGLSDAVEVVDRMLAEAEKPAEAASERLLDELAYRDAEKPAEPPKDREGDGQPDWVWKSSKTARQCVETALELADAPSLDDDQLDAVAALLDGPRPKDREGDDVLRALDHHLRAMSDHTDPDRWRGSVESALRTIRRALGEEVKS